MHARHPRRLHRTFRRGAAHRRRCSSSSSSASSITCAARTSARATRWSDISPVGVPIEGFPPVPPPKIYRLLEGGTTQMPHVTALGNAGGAAAALPRRAAGADRRRACWPRSDPAPTRCARTSRCMSQGLPQVQPLRVALGLERWRRARPTRAACACRTRAGAGRHRRRAVGRPGGEDPAISRSGARPRRHARQAAVLLPIYYAAIRPKRRRSCWSTRCWPHQFADVPRTAHPEEITAREEDRVNAYYAGGTNVRARARGRAVTVITAGPRVTRGMSARHAPPRRARAGPAARGGDLVWQGATALAGHRGAAIPRSARLPPIAGR